MDVDDTVDLVFIVLLLNEARKCLDIKSGRRTREVTKNPQRVINLTRNIAGPEVEDPAFSQYFNKICHNNTENFKEMINMSQEVFALLFNLVKLDLTKYSNRQAITPKCRLFLTLVYLANGGSRKTLSTDFEMGLSTVQSIVSETCRVLWTALSKTYLSTKQAPDWIKLCRQFELKWHLPNCVGAMDTKTIVLRCPPKDVQNLHDKKGRYSIAILAACDANYTFIGVDTAVFGYKEDNEVWSTGFAENLFKGELNLPADNVLPNSEIRFPYYFVGDTLCPMKSHIMRLYPGRSLSESRKVFNLRLERARQIIDNTFGLLGARWRVLTNPLTLSPQNMENILKATVLLHNFARTHDRSYCPFGFMDRYEGDTLVPGDWRDEITPLQKAKRLYANNATQQAFKQRDMLCEYIENYPIA